MFYFFSNLLVPFHSTLLPSQKWRLSQDFWAFQPSVFASTSLNSQEGKLFIINSRANQLPPLLPVAMCESEISTAWRCSADQSWRSEDTSVTLPIYWTKFGIEGKFLVAITEIHRILSSQIDVWCCWCDTGAVDTVNVLTLQLYQRTPCCGIS